jgi:glycosyltransferase involved in cell wall biosynthesis
MGLRIGLVTGEYPPMEGGVGSFTQALGVAMAEQGHEIHIITSRSARPANETRNWRALREPHELDFGWLHPVADRWGWGDVNKIADISLRFQLDVINIQYQAAAFNMRRPAINLSPFRLRGLCRCVVTYHDMRAPYLFPKAGRLRQRIVRLMGVAAHGVIVTNPEDETAWRESSSRPVRQIPIGSNVQVHDASKEEVTQVRARMGLDGDAALLGYFGFLHPSKGADTLIEAVALLERSVHVVFIGGRLGESDSDTNRRFVAGIEEKIRKLNLENRIHWTGFVPDNEVSAYMAASDLMVMPYQDGVSLRRGTLMAILAHGRPLLSTISDGDIHPLSHGENCWLVPAGDASSLANAVNMLLDSGELRRRLGRAAAAIAAQFSWQKIAAETIAFFEEL